ncbi:IS701 family transposase, partial [Microcoleus sp. S13_B4]
MLTILNYAQALVYTLMDVMPSKYQQKSLRALLGLFLEATGQSLPFLSQTVSASAISRFLNHYQWSVRAVMRVVRTEIIRQVKAERGVGRRPILTVILDMTTLEKIGKFSGLGKLIRVYNGKRGLHLLVLYILVGRSRVPWGFRVYRGKGEFAPIKLGQRLLKTLPKTLTAHYEIRVLGDSA